MYKNFLVPTKVILCTWCYLRVSLEPSLVAPLQLCEVETQVDCKLVKTATWNDSRFGGCFDETSNKGILGI